MIGTVKDTDPNTKSQNNNDWIQYLVTVHHIIEDEIRRTVISHQEHIILVQQNVRYVGHDTEEAENGARNPYVIALHARHARNYDIERCKSRDRMRNSRNDIGEGKHWIASVVLCRSIRAKHGTEQAEYENEIQRRRFHSPFRKRRKWNGDQLNGAKIKGQCVRKASPNAIGIRAVHDDFEDFKAIDQKCRPHQNMILLFLIRVSVSFAKKDCKADHNCHQKRNEG